MHLVTREQPLGLRRYLPDLRGVSYGIEERWDPSLIAYLSEQLNPPAKGLIWRSVLCATAEAVMIAGCRR